MQSGGTLLGQGVYGCTFEPAPRCAGGPVFKKIHGRTPVGKVVDEDPTQELAIGKEIMALPLAPAYFALPSAACKPMMPILDPEAKGCRVMTESGEGTKFSMLIMPEAGIPIVKYAADLKRLADNYKRIFVHLLEGATIYQQAGYVHNDIHMGNILVDEAGIARYIDFGLAFRPADVERWEDTNIGTDFKPKFFMQAPEIHAVRMKTSGVHLTEGVAILKELHPEYVILERQYPTRKDALSAMIGVLREGDNLHLIRTYAMKIDSWRIGLCMWSFWNDLLKVGPFAQTPLYKERERIRRVLGGLTDFDPRTRLSVSEALQILDPKNRIPNDRA